MQRRRRSPLAAVCAGFAFLQLILGSTARELGEAVAKSTTRQRHVHSSYHYHNTLQRSKATTDEVARLLSRVAKDLQPWQESGVTLEMVERAYCSEDNGEGMRIQVVAGQVFIVPPARLFQTRARTTQLQIASLAQHYELPDLDFMLYFADTCQPPNLPHRSYDGNYERCPSSAPLFSLDKLPNETCVLVPDFTFGGWPEAFLPSWPQTWGLMADAADAHDWEQRDNALFWKGAATSLQRSIVSTSELFRNSELTNINLIDWDGSETDFAAEFVSLPQHCHHKYLLHMAGFTYSSRLKYLMSCGSVVVFPRPQVFHEEFWYHMLDAGNHVETPLITEANDGAVLLEALRDLQADSAKSQQIAGAARHLAKEVLHPDNIDKYWLELFSQYSALQRFEVRRHPDAVPIETVILRPDLSLPSLKRTCSVC